MSPDAKRLLREALELEPEARAALSGMLLDSLEEPVDPQAEAEWDREIARRVREIDGGAVSTVPWAVARRAIAGRE